MVCVKNITDMTWSAWNRPEAEKLEQSNFISRKTLAILDHFFRPVAGEEMFSPPDYGASSRSSRKK